MPHPIIRLPSMPTASTGKAMVLLHMLSSSPLRTWPALIVFFTLKLVWPKVWSRLRHGVSLEVRAMEHVIQTTKQGEETVVVAREGWRDSSLAWRGRYIPWRYSL